MKTTLLVLCILCASAAFAQTSPSMSNAVTFNDHSMRASSQSLAATTDLLGASSITMAQGEMPLWEVPLESHEVSLGNVARSFRQEHLAAKKARVVWENQTLNNDAVKSPVR